jgi:hypothetical protein
MEVDLSEISMGDVDRAEFLLKRQFENISLDNLPVRGVVAGLGFPMSPSPTETAKEKTLETIKELRKRIRTRSL